MSDVRKIAGYCFASLAYSGTKGMRSLDLDIRTSPKAGMFCPGTVRKIHFIMSSILFDEIWLDIMKLGEDDQNKNGPKKKNGLAGRWISIYVDRAEEVKYGFRYHAIEADGDIGIFEEKEETYLDVKPEELPMRQKKEASVEIMTDDDSEV